LTSSRTFAVAIESASRFKSACVSVSTQWRSSKITISGWRIDSRSIGNAILRLRLQIFRRNRTHAIGRNAEELGNVITGFYELINGAGNA